MAGDFNRHNTLWGGTAVRDKRRGEAKPILDIMETFLLISLLPSGTVTRRQGDKELTINLILFTAKLAEATICCHIHNT